MALDASFPQAWLSQAISLIAANGTQAKVLFQKQPQIGNLLGGFRVFDGQIASTDAVAKSLIVWQGQELTLEGAAGAPTIGSTSGFSRSAGSFLTDGWRVGDSAMLVPGANGPYGGTAANYGALLQTTAVSALALTVNGTPLTVEAWQAGARLVRVAQRTRLPIPANSGNADATPPVPMLTGTQNPSSALLPDTGWQFGPNDIVLVSVAAAVAALPARIDVVAHAGLY